jgi:hypothetical protein
MTDGMETPPSEVGTDPTYARARERAEMLQGYWIHLLIYLVVNAGLFAINYIATSGEGGWWFQWTALGWGIGLLIHTIIVVSPVFGSDWVDRKTRKLVERGQH